MRRRQGIHRDPLWTRIRIFLHFWLYYIPIGFPLMCITAPVWLPAILAKTSPLWDISDITLFFFEAPGLAFSWLVGVYRRVILDPYRLYRNERRIRRLEPASLPVKRPRRLNEGRKIMQTAPLLTKLPLELRLMIYEDAIKCGSEHRHVFEVKRQSPMARKKDRQQRHLRNRVWGAGCKAGLMTLYSFNTAIYITRVTPCCPISLSVGADPCIEKNSLGGPIALAKTCRQIYSETIDMYYGQSIYGPFIKSDSLSACRASNVLFL